MNGHVDECDVRGWGWDLALVDDEQAPNTPYRRGWSHITEADLAGAVLAPGVDFLYIPSATPVLEPDEVVHPTPDLMATLTPRKEPLMLPAPPVPESLLEAALPPALPVRRRPTAVVHLTNVAVLDKIVADIDREVERLLEAKARILAAVA